MIKRFLIVLILVNSAIGETLTEIVDTALQESPYLKKYQYQSKSVEGEIEKAKAYKNPNLNIEFGRVFSQIEGESGFNITSFSFTQPLRLWGERKYQIKSAKLKKISFENFYKFQKNVLISNIYKTFYSALALKEKIKTKKQEIETLEKLYDFVEKSYKYGEIVQLDVFRVEKDLNISKVQLEQLKAQLQSKINFLSFLAGKDISDVEGDFYKFKDLRNTKVENLPEVIYQKYLIDSLDQQIKRQKALSKPKISFGIGASEDEVDLGKYDVGFSISSKIPVFYRNQGEIIQLINQKRLMYEKLRQIKLNYKLSLDSIQKQIKILKEQYLRVNEKVIPAVTNALKLADKSYKLRTITFFEFSSIRKQYYETVYYKIQLAEEIQNLYGDYIKISIHTKNCGLLLLFQYRIYQFFTKEKK
jgi:outer membrane protein TolC